MYLTKKYAALKSLQQVHLSLSDWDFHILHKLRGSKTEKIVIRTALILSLIAQFTHMSVQLVPALWLCAESCQSLQIPRLWLKEHAFSVITRWEPFIAKTTYAALTNSCRQCSSVCWADSATQHPNVLFYYSNKLVWLGLQSLNSFISFVGEILKSVAGMRKLLECLVKRSIYSVTFDVEVIVFITTLLSVPVSLHKPLLFFTLSLKEKHQGIAANWQDKSNST